MLVSIVAFGSEPEVCLARSQEEGEIAQAVRKLVTKGTTDLAGALSAAAGLVKSDERTVVFAYTDGHPNSTPKAMAAAKDLHAVVDQVATFGVGSVADHDLLRDFIATTPGDHTEGTTEDIPNMYSTLVDLYLRPTVPTEGV